jgi:hypothetical protein
VRDVLGIPDWVARVGVTRKQLVSEESDFACVMPLWFVWRLAGRFRWAVHVLLRFSPYTEKCVKEGEECAKEHEHDDLIPFAFW